MDSGGHLHGKPTLRRVAVKSDNKIREQEQENWEELEPVTPAGRLFNQPSLNCYILVIFGFKTQMDVEALKAGLEATLIKHKRFSSIVKEDKRGVLKWMPVDVNIDDHVLLPFIDPADNCNRNFVQQYTAKLATAPPLHPSRPLWQIHLLRVRSEEAASSLVMRVHHSLGDGVSLMSLLLACTRKASDSQSLPTIPRHTSTRPNNGRGGLRVLFLIMALYNLFLVIWYTTVDITLFLATIVWIKDSKTPIKGYPGVESSPKQIEYATFSLEDFKIVKTAVNGTINDVMLGMTSAGILRYLEREYEAKAEGISKSEKRNIGDKQSLPSNLRVRSAILVNTRPAPGLHDLADMMKSGKEARWGNNLGYLILPLLMVKQQNPLDYVSTATAMTRKKKLSLEGPFTYASGNLLMKLAGAKAATAVTYRMIAHTSISFSNIVGPVEEVEFFGHPIVHMIPTVSGHPHSITIHFQSYMERVVLVLAAASEVIRDPKQLCMDCVDAFDRMKQAAIASRQS